MVKSKGNYDWQRTTSILSCLINQNRKKGAKAVSPNELNPYADHKAKDQTVITGKQAWDILKSVMTASNPTIEKTHA